MKVVNWAQVDAQFPFPTGDDQLGSLRLNGENISPMVTFLGDRTWVGKVKRSAYISTHLRSKGGVVGMGTDGVGHTS